MVILHLVSEKQSLAVQCKVVQQYHCVYDKSDPICKNGSTVARHKRSVWWMPVGPFISNLNLWGGRNHSNNHEEDKPQ